MLSIQNISKSYGEQVLFDKATLQMSPRERLGLVGRNGYGKSTLFRMILGDEDPDTGLVTTPKNYRIGHLEQHLHFTQSTVLEEACLGLQAGEEHDHYKAERILFGLGFGRDDMYRSPSEFSGGYQIRINLAKVLVSNPHLLLLDEPTNYLDIVSIRWMTGFLRSWKNELILISHDREFMDAVTTHTALIHRRKIRKVEGGTSKLYALVAQEEETFEKTRQNEEKQRKHAEAFIDRFRAQAGRAAMVQSRLKRLEKMPKLEELEAIDDLSFEFHYQPVEAKTLMDINGITFGYNPEHLLIHDLSFSVKASDRIAIIGKNGKGKSTLLNLLAGEIQPQSGTLRTHPDTRVGYFGQTNIARLDPKETVEGEIFNSNTRLSRTEVRGICGVMMFSGDLAEKKIQNLSGGEKSRVLLGKILAQPANLLFLDEPTNHLDMSSIEALMDSIQNFEGAVLVVTHSEAILRTLATKLIIFERGGVRVYDGSYDDFLSSIGWEDEEESVSKSKSGANSKKRKKEWESQKIKIINPLKKEMSSLEQEIMGLEKELSAMQALLPEISKDHVRLAEVSKQIKKNQKLIDEKFLRLEQVSIKLVQQEEYFKEIMDGEDL